MDVVPIGVAIFLLVAVVVAAATHWFLRRYLLACVISGLAAPFVFALVCKLRGEALEVPPAGVFVLFTVMSLLVSVAVGSLVILARRLLPKWS